MNERAERAGCGVAAVANCFRLRQEEIRNEWLTRVERDPEVPSERLTLRELEDDIPNLLGHIVSALEAFGRWQDDAEARGELAGRGPPTLNHLRLRMRKGFDATEVLRELHHLREALVDACDREHVILGGAAARIVHASIDAAMALAVRLTTEQEV